MLRDGTFPRPGQPAKRREKNISKHGRGEETDNRRAGKHRVVLSLAKCMTLSARRSSRGTSACPSKWSRLGKHSLDGHGEGAYPSSRPFRPLNGTAKFPSQGSMTVCRPVSLMLPRSRGKTLRGEAGTRLEATLQRCARGRAAATSSGMLERALRLP